VLLATPASAAQSPATRSSALVNQGAAQAASGDFAAAINSYQEALKISPRDLTAEMALAQTYRRVHNYPEARRILEDAGREHPKSPLPLLHLGDLDIEMQTYEAAIQNLKAAVTLDPTNNEARNRLAVAYQSNDNLPDALDQLAKVVARDPRNALAYYTRAQIYASQNENQVALRDAEKVVELQPQNPRGRELLGEILLREPSYPSPATKAARCAQAVDVLNPLMPAQSGDSRTLYLLARAYKCSGDEARAQETMQAFEAASQNDRSVKEAQTQAKHLVEQAGDLAMKNDFRGSMSLLDQAIQIDPTYGAAYSQQAKLYYSAGDLEKANEAIKKALDRDPYQPEFLYVQGKILEKKGATDDALEAFRKVTLIDPKEADAYFEMGNIFNQRRDHAQALAAFKKAVELSPDDRDYRQAFESLGGSAPAH
jgi:tetratricopeptide (TPR) repeat protein